MERPAPRLRAELAAIGIHVSEEVAEAAFRAEIAYYLRHHLDGRDEGSLDDLRDRCAAVVREALGVPEARLPPIREAMLRALRFTAYPDAAPAIGELKRRGLRLVVASNWDSSFPEVLERVGLAPMVDAVVTSAVAGAAKPDPRLFRAALAAAGCDPSGAVHVGDSLENDLEGARRAGIRAILLARGEPPPAGRPAIRTLLELPALI